MEFEIKESGPPPPSKTGGRHDLLKYRKIMDMVMASPHRWFCIELADKKAIHLLGAVFHNRKTKGAPIEYATRGTSFFIRYAPGEQKPE